MWAGALCRKKSTPLLNQYKLLSVQGDRNNLALVKRVELAGVDPAF
jgi:hypothetical protein